MSIYRLVGKRAFDLMVSLTVGVLTAPVHVACAAAVGLTSGRPIYFAQERIGRDGKPFRLYKFRTMKVGTHEASGGYPTADMVTPIGKALRTSSLDELPQILNIVRGNMSLVGPRPALADQVARYTHAQRGRLAVRPGLTGLAQIRYRNAAPWSVRITSDLEYVGRVSLLNDLRIMAGTIPALLRGGLVQLGQSFDQVDDLGPSDRSLP